MPGASRLALFVVALVGCGDTALDCAVRCGDRCLPASACSADVVCPADQPCDPCSGQCRATCTPGGACKDPALTCCADGRGSGVCSDLTVDPAACGACGTSCGAGADRCDAGACSCGDLGHPCGAGTLCCGGACVPQDETRCGGCGVACDPGETCDANAGACRCGDRATIAGSACGASASCCGGACTPTQTDPSNCGGCGLGCAAGQKCLDGHCDCSQAGCADASQTCCGGRCASLASDPQFCGACNVSCNPGELCTGGACACPGGLGSKCAAGQTCCSDGCQDLQGDRRNCGACGVSCGNGEVCAAGKCTCGATARSGPACLGGTLCCGGVCKMVSNDTNNCGRCDYVCDPQVATSCSGGHCICPAANMQCPPSLHCAVQGCICDGTVCPGCCRDDSCFVLTPAACGANGDPCQTCDVNANSCSPTGQCECTTNTGGSACTFGLQCTGAGCQCTTASCDGCCSPSATTPACVRLGGQSDMVCGHGGMTCAACPQGQGCVLGTCG